MAPSYFGLTGFTTGGQVHQVLESLPDVLPRKIMIGVLASTKTLAGVLTRKPKRSPHPTTISAIFTDDNRCLNLVHYNAESGADWVSELYCIVDLSGPHLHGFQLNMAWPDVDKLGAFKRQYPDLKIVLQVGSNAMKTARGGEPIPVRGEKGTPPTDYERVAANICSYTSVGLADYVLIDPSGGQGKGFDMDQAQVALSLITSTCAPVFQVGIAGGLSAENLGNLEALLHTYPALCWDAEGGLRNAEDDLDISSAIDYAQASTALAAWYA